MQCQPLHHDITKINQLWNIIRCIWVFFFPRKWREKDYNCTRKILKSEFPVTRENCRGSLLEDYISWNETCSYRVVLARARSKVLSEIPLGARKTHIWRAKWTCMDKITFWFEAEIEVFRLYKEYRTRCKISSVKVNSCYWRKLRGLEPQHTAEASLRSLKRAGNYYQIRMRSLQFALLLTADALSSCEHQSSPSYIWRSSDFPAISGFVLAFTVWLWNIIKMASSSDDEEANSSERFDNLCRDLNMDEETSQEAWSSYEKISTNYTLEVPFVCVRLCSLHVCFESYV